MSDICLIIPPSPFLLDDRVFPSLGILRVAASLEAQGASVDLLDLAGVQNYQEVLSIYLRSNRETRVFGVTATTPQYPQAHEISKILGNENKRVIIGGPHPTLVSAAWKREIKKGVEGRAYRAYEQLLTTFDGVFAGDGDMIPLESFLNDDEKFIDADDPKSKLFMTDSSYETSAGTARKLIDLESYKYTIEGHKATSVIGQLGCPFACNFCGGRYSPMLRRIRTRSTSSILSELEMLHVNHGYTGFMFYDDELNVSKSIIELMDGISDLQKSLKTEFRLRGFVKAEIFTEEQAAAMYRAGFRWLLTGFESGSPRILENINKKATREDNTRAVQIGRNNGLKVKALMSIGHPGESLETVKDTESWLLEVKPDDFDVTIITTYPGSPYYDDAECNDNNTWTYIAKSGDKLHAEELDYTVTADYYKGDPNGGYKSYVWTDYLSQLDLVRERDKLERDVRAALNIPFNPSAASLNYEHSMGQGLPLSILRQSINNQKKKIVRLPVV